MVDRDKIVWEASKYHRSTGYPDTNSVVIYEDGVSSEVTGYGGRQTRFLVPGFRLLYLHDILNILLLDTSQNL